MNGAAKVTLKIDLQFLNDDWRQLENIEELAKRAARAAFEAAQMSRFEPCGAEREEKGDIEVTLAFSDDEHVRRLNLEFRGQDKPTNVLSFPSGEDEIAMPGPDAPSRTCAIGDVIFARETILREAGEMNIPPRHHLAHLVAHGVLHLCGHDHINDEEAEIMENLERRALASMGVDDPYRDRSDPEGEEGELEGSGR
jgi:probable rRNA maturation factor